MTPTLWLIYLAGYPIVLAFAGVATLRAGSERGHRGGTAFWIMFVLAGAVWTAVFLAFITG